MIALQTLAAVEAALPAPDAPPLSRSDVHRRLGEPLHTPRHTANALRELERSGRAISIPTETRFAVGEPVRLYRRAPAAAFHPGGNTMVARKKPDPIDRLVGARVRYRRNELGMSQTTLGDALGITFQQVQKNEKGANRIGASRLQSIATILGVPVSYFFEGAPVFEDSSPERAIGAAPSLAPDVTDLTHFLASPYGARIVRSLSSITSEPVKRRVADLVAAIAAEPPRATP